MNMILMTNFDKSLNDNCQFCVFKKQLRISQNFNI